VHVGVAAHPWRGDQRDAEQHIDDSVRRKWNPLEEAERLPGEQRDGEHAARDRREIISWLAGESNCERTDEEREHEQVVDQSVDAGRDQARHKNRNDVRRAIGWAAPGSELAHSEEPIGR
jgi:hypothetical protein